MKKLLIAFAIFLALCATACSGNQTNSVENPDTIIVDSIPTDTIA